MTTVKEETLGQRIRAQRIRMGMTQEELAEKTLIPKPTISSYGNDRVDIKSSVVAELAEVLGTYPNYLILGDKAPDLKTKNLLINLKSGSTLWLGRIY